MYNYYKIKSWHDNTKESSESSYVQINDMGDSFSRHYVKTKLENGLLRVWRVSVIEICVTAFAMPYVNIHIIITHNCGVRRTAFQGWEMLIRVVQGCHILTYRAWKHDPFAKKTCFFIEMHLISHGLRVRCYACMCLAHTILGGQIECACV